MNRILQPIFVFIAIIFLVFSSHAQSIDLDVNGISIQASHRLITRKLGKPISDRRIGEVPCGGPMRTLQYDGLILRLEVGNDNPLGLYKAEVTSRRWRISGVRIGDSKRKVIRTFGRAGELKESGRRYLSYFMRDGWARFYLDGNHLKKVEWEYNFC